MATDNKDNKLSIGSGDYAEILRHAVAVIGNNKKLQRSVALLPWSHNMLLLSKGLDDDATLYYATKTVEKGWNRDLLLNAIKLNMYETQALARVDNNFDRTLPIEQAQYTNELFGSSYNLGFLGVTSPIRSNRVGGKY